MTMRGGPVGGDPGSRSAPPRRGGLPPARPDQRYAPPVQGSVPPGSKNVFIGRLVVVEGANDGVFLYKAAPARGTLVAAAVGQAGTDPTGQNTVTPVLAVGAWSPVTGLPAGQSSVDDFGDLSVTGPDGAVRFKIYTGADGSHDPGAAYWFNDFGAVIQLIDPVVRATIQYQDLGSASQGGVIGAQVAATSAVVEPVTGRTLQPGVALIDPVFGDNILIQGDVVAFQQLGMTRKAFISSQDPTGPTSSPFLQVDAPEHTTAQHLVAYLAGASQDGTTRPFGTYMLKTVAGVPPAPVFQSASLLELQPGATQDAVNLFLAAATVIALHVLVSGDTNDRLSMNANGVLSWGTGAAAADTSLQRSGVGTLRVGSHLQALGLFQAISQAAGSLIFEGLAAGDTVPRIEIDNNGKVSWGPGGAAAVDAFLSRQAAGTLLIQTNLAVAQGSAAWPTINLTSGGATGVQVAGLGGNWALAALVTGDTNPRVAVFNTSADGIQFGPGNAALDTKIARTGAARLSTGMLDVTTLNVGEFNQGAIATNGTIDTFTTAGTGSTYLTPAAAVTGIIMQVGTVAGQEHWVVNNSAFLITFAASGSNVANGSNITVPARQARKFVWSVAGGLWFAS